MKKILLFTLLSLPSLVISQERMGYFEHSLQKNDSKIKDAFAIANPKNGEVGIFLSSSKEVYAYLLNSNFEVFRKISSRQKNRKYKTLIGSEIKENDKNYLVFLANKARDKFMFINFDFANSRTRMEEFALQDSGERFLQTAQFNNQFYLVSKSMSGYLYIYSLGDKNKIIRNQVDLLKVDQGKRKELNLAISSIAMADEIVKIEQNTPNSIEVVAEKIKFYAKDGSIIFSVDDRDDFTFVLEIDLKTYTPDFKTFKKELFGKEKTNTNSFIIDDHILILSTNKNNMNLNILDYSDESLIKTYSISKKDKIAFKNTPIIQEGSIYKNYREMEETNRFLRKINSSNNVGISVIRRNNYYQTTIGGYVKKSVQTRLHTPDALAPFSPITSYDIFFSNSAMGPFQSYTYSKSTRIECLFDFDFNHKKGNIADNAFDKMKENEFDFVDSNGSTVFGYKDFFVKGSYFEKEKIYLLEKFTN